MPSKDISLVDIWGGTDTTWRHMDYKTMNLFYLKTSIASDIIIPFMWVVPLHAT